MSPGNPCRPASYPGYNIRLTFFLNARHRVALGREAGPVHNHSWRLEVNLRSFLRESPSLPAVEFADLEQQIRAVLRPYEGQFLNDLSPFDKYVPVTENIARFLFGAISRAVAGTGAEVIEVTLWEAPTKGVTVCTPLETHEALNEAAAARELLPPKGAEAPSPPGPGSGPDPRPHEKDPTQVASRVATRSAPIRAPGLILASALILALAAIAYRPLLAPEPGAGYPWGSDTWGHLFKALFLYNQLASGDAYPLFMPWWYTGLEPFRYWSPLPYYLLAALRYLTGDIFAAGAWLVPLAAAFGGLSWLAFSRRLGWLGATAAGMAWTVWPDHVRVALAEGNLPRVLATAFLPLLFLAFLDSLERRRWPWSGLGFVVLLNLVVLSHAMVAAITCVGLTVFSFLYWWFAGIRFRDVARGLSLTILGLLVSAWWLIPSLSGGIAAMGAEAVGQAVAYFPVSVSLNPLARLADPEIFYWGLSSVVLLALVALTWRQRSALSRALSICGLLAIIITLPVARPVISVLPGSHLLWPTRFASVAAVAIFASALAWKPAPAPAAPRRAFPWRSAMTVLLAVIVLADSWGSAGLVRTRAPQSDLAETAGRLSTDGPGWRVAVLDLGRLGSEPSFVLSQKGAREQVFGWAWQGAAIGPDLVLLNTALEQRRYSYVADRALQLGATDLVVPKGQVSLPLFDQAAALRGYTERETIGSLELYRHPSPPMAFLSPYKVLAIGELAGNASLLFPAIETGSSPDIDAYDAETLSCYQVVFLTGATWRSARRAEELIRGYVKGGGKVVVDLTGFPATVLSKRPTFLGVTGEPIQLTETPVIRSPAGDFRLASFVDLYNPWVALVPQGLDRVVLSFDHFGQPAALVGEKDVEGGAVTFVGLNLPFHALLTGDKEALRVLGDLLGLEPSTIPARESVTLTSYRATPQGYAFGLTIPDGWSGGRVILPFAAQDSLVVYVDGRQCVTRSIEHLLAIEAVPGRHEVTIEVKGPPLAPVSAIISVLVTFLIAAYVVTQSARVSSRSKKGVAG